MGILAESKSRRKISRDPNNTRWTSDTSTFGQKILRAHGWEPGQFLGAQGAAHSDLHTAANASYIRVSLKDDLKGLGYNMAKEDKVTGLDVFSDLLSRLNGKSEEDIEGQRQARLAIKTNMYVEQKWGPMRFVRGGFLVGDKMEGDAEKTGQEGAKTEIVEKKRGDKKRKLADVDAGDAETTESREEKKRRREERRARKGSSKAVPDKAEDAAPSGAAKERRKRSSREKSLGSADADGEQEKGEAPDDDGRKRKSKSKPNDAQDEDGRKRKSKSKPKDAPHDDGPKQKSKSKSKRRQSPSADESVSTQSTKQIADGKDKEKRKRQKAEAETQPIEVEACEPREDEAQQQQAGAAASGVSTASGPSTGASTPRGGRNFARSRFIAAKRQAMLDAQALKQIFMVKT